MHLLSPTNVAYFGTVAGETWLAGCAALIGRRLLADAPDGEVAAMMLPVSHLELRVPPLGLLFWLLLFGVSAYVLLTHQPLGRPKPDLEERFRRLDVEARLRDDAARPRRRLAGPGGRETWTASLLADLGGAAQRALNGLGIAGGEALEQRLALARPNIDFGQWYGEKVALGVVWVLFVIGAGLLGVRPFGSLPVGLWLLAFLGGYLPPRYPLTSNRAGSPHAGAHGAALPCSIGWPWQSRPGSA